MNNPLVSIIIPVYNVESYLVRCLKSVLNQSYKNIEVLAINDGSTDNSLLILEEMKVKDERLKIINKKNGGQASARNLGLQLAKGEYIAFVDSDDYLALEMVEKCVSKINESNYDLIIFDFYNVNNQNQKQYFKTGTRVDNARTVPWNKFYHRSLWEESVFPEGYWYEDLGIIPAIVVNAKNIAKIEEPLYYYETSRISSQTNILNYNKLYDVIYMLEHTYREIKMKNKVMYNPEEIEFLFIEHLLFVTVLLKLPNIKDTNIKKKLVKEINNSIDKYIPDWKSSNYQSGNIINNNLKQIVINQYLKERFLLGDLLWKYPKKIKKIIKGF